MTLRRRCLALAVVAALMAGCQGARALTSAPSTHPPAGVSSRPPNAGDGSAPAPRSNHPPPSPSHSASDGGRRSSGDRDLLVVWARGLLPADGSARIGRLPGVRAVASVASGPVWLRASFATDGTAVQRVGGGFAIPLDAAGADPAALSAVLGPSSSAWIGQLRRGRAVLSRTSAALRRVGPGATFQLTTGTIGVGAVAPDVQVGAHEVFLSSRTAATLGVVHPAYLLVRLARAADPARAVRAIRSLLTPGPPVRIRSQARTAYLRQADGVLPPEWSKVYFGEFAARPGPGGTLVMDPAWERAHITQARVPILGVVRCNRALLAPLRGALSRVRREGLGSLVDRRDFGGCFAARLTRGSSAVISAHAWGAAVDVNVSRNLLGETPHQDPRLVEAFTRMGFVWGGRFLLPDGMHFEYGCPDRYGIPEQVRVPDPLLRLALCRPG